MEAKETSTEELINAYKKVNEFVTFLEKEKQKIEKEK